MSGLEREDSWREKVGKEQVDGGESEVGEAEKRTGGPESEGAKRERGRERMRMSGIPPGKQNAGERY